MSTPLSPGWYPAPDGQGEQWWNGTGWSDTRRNADGTAPGLPGYQAAPPAGEAAPAPLPVPPPPSRISQAVTSDGSGITAIIFGVIGLTVFHLFAAIAIVVGLATLRSNTWVGRFLALVGIALGVAGVVFAIVGWVQSGYRDWDRLIFS